MNENDPKISGVEAFILMTAAILIDIAGIVLVLFGLDDFFILDVFTSTIPAYLWFKGIKGIQRNVIGTVAEWIPYVGALPLASVTLGLSIWANWHPDSTIAKAANLASANQGNTHGVKIVKDLRGQRPLPTTDVVNNTPA